jgi:hypothetical protein
MIPSALLVCYHPGARGDFLAAILLNRLAGQLSWGVDTKHISTNIPYKKVHYYESVAVPSDIYNCNMNDIIKSFSIRIKPNTISDFLTIVYYIKQKISPPISETESFNNILRHELHHKKLNNLFNVVVDFTNLYNIDYLTTLYNSYVNLNSNGNKLSLAIDDIQNISHNISINPIVTIENYKEYIPNIDIVAVQDNFNSYESLNTL